MRVVVCGLSFYLRPSSCSERAKTHFRIFASSLTMMSSTDITLQAGAITLLLGMPTRRIASLVYTSDMSSIREASLGFQVAEEC